MNKAFAKILSIFLTLLSCCFYFSCDKNNTRTDTIEFVSEASVITLDVASGNATLIKTPTLTFLIDCGSGSRLGESTVKKIKSYGVSDIDYFVLTHMDEAHIGATELILQNFNVKTAYLPDIPKSYLSNYSLYQNHYSSIINKLGEDKVRYNVLYENVIFDGGIFMLLSPLDSMHKNSSYATLLSTTTPTESQIDDICPIVYFSYKGVRFVVSGDAGKSQEEIVIKNNQTDLYNKAINKTDLIDLNEVEFFSLSKHGNDTANSNNYIKLLKPKNALVSLSSQNQGCPKTSVLESIYNENSDCKFYNTMLVGDICTYINANGEYKVATQKET